MNSGENKFRWNEELYDHKRRLEVSAWSIWQRLMAPGCDLAHIRSPLLRDEPHAENDFSMNKGANLCLRTTLN